MPQQLDDRRRRVVPRWRPFREAAQLELLNPSRPIDRIRPKPAAGELERLDQEWRRHRTPIYAAGLVDAAIVAGQPQIAAEAAAYLLEASANPLTRDMARSLLSIPGDRQPSAEPVVLSKQERYRRIAVARRHLRVRPRDPVRWVDLALDYAILGQNLPAEQALRRALALAPESRFVLRSAARFFLHSGQEEQAHHILCRTERTRQDPWLLAAELVTAGFIEKTSRWIKLAQGMVNSGVFTPRHISELAGALGTIEYEHGARRKTRRLFEKGLIDPTENTVAQAGWIARHMASFDADPINAELPRAYEAGAWEQFLRGDYTAAVHMSRKWLADEPFATRPAMFGSWVASTALGDFETAAALAEAAQDANPGDPRPIAQLAFCYGSQNQLTLAEDALRRLKVVLRCPAGGHDREEWEVLEDANRGLIAYRRGLIADGRLHYERAIQRAAAHRWRELAAGALVYFAGEEARVSPETAPEQIQQAHAALSVWPASVRQAYERVVERFAAAVPGDPKRRA